MPVTGYAKVTLTVQVAVSGTWGDDCSLGQLYHQAAEEAVGTLRQKFPSLAHGVGDVLLVGEPKVEAVVLPERPKG